MQPPIHLIKEFDNAVFFLNEGNGKFNPSAFIIGATYEVQGSTAPQRSVAPNPISPTFSQAMSPYGTYPVPQYPQSNPVPHVPSPRVRQRIIKKTMLLAKLALRDVSKPSSSRANRLTHTVITSVVVSLDQSMGECNVASAAEIVKRQVGFEVILLDSKLYPLIESEATSGFDYWKSTRKIIATSRTVYEKLIGKSPAEEIKQVDEDVVVVDHPRKKIKLTSDGDDVVILTKLEEVEKAVREINEKLGFLGELKKAFECIICRLPSESPVVTMCCQRVVGCDECVKKWREAHSRCPLCSVEGRMRECFNLKGVDGVTGLFRVGDDRESAIDDGDPIISISEDSANEFDEFQVFRRNNSS